MKPVHFEISLCSSFLTPLLYVLLDGKFYHIYFCQQKSCLRNVIEVFQYILFHILGTQKLIFYYAHQCWHVQDSQ